MVFFSEFTPDMERLVGGILQDFCKPHCLLYPAWNAAMGESRLFQLYCDLANTGLVPRSTRSMMAARRLIKFLSRVTLSNECNWTILELEDGAIG